MSAVIRQRRAWVVLVGLAWLALSVGNARSTLRGQVSPNGDVPIYTNFPANAGSLGAIPDHVAGCDATGAAPRDVTFTVSGLVGQVNSVKVTFAGTHTWVGDLEVRLIAPGGASESVFGRTGSTTATGCGDNSDFAGPYTFFDFAVAPPNGGWWQTATLVGATVPMTSGSYRATNIGGVGAVNPQPPISLDPTFAGVSPNGTWTLRFSDHGGGDTGQINSATLGLSTLVPYVATHDIDGDAKTDAVVGRCPPGCVLTSPITMFFRRSSDAGLVAQSWGFPSDFFPMADYDGDRKVDLTAWRSGTSAVFHTFQSSTQSYVPLQWGTTNDIPYAMGDFDGDSRYDYSVFRPSTGTWFISRSTAGFLAQPWGQNGDKVTPGDYDGDHISDFAIVRGGVFHILGSTSGYIAIPWGLQSDGVPPGDYDGDGKTDPAAIRAQTGQLFWYVRRSSDAALFAVQWGFAADFPAPGDYDGDHKMDIAIWRPSDGTFYIRRSSDGGLTAIPWGGAGNNDIPMTFFLVR